MKIALFAGSFSPPTLGHLDMIRRSLAVCDRLVVGIGHNPGKKDQLFKPDEIKEMLEKVVAEMDGVEVCLFTGLAFEYAGEIGADFLIRGLRPYGDLEPEFRMALSNRKMGGIETLFLVAGEEVSHISSSLIREIGSFGGSLKEFVPEEIEPLVRKRCQML